MMGKADILRLSISERIQLVQDIWDSIAEVPDSVLLTDEQKAELQFNNGIWSIGLHTCFSQKPSRFPAIHNVRLAPDHFRRPSSAF